MTTMTMMLNDNGPEFNDALKRPADNDSRIHATVLSTQPGREHVN